MSDSNQNGTVVLSQEPPLLIRRRLLDVELTMMPENAIKAMKIAESPDCDIDGFAQVVACDPKLASDMLALANSAAFGSPNATSNIRDAVVRLGLRGCRHLVVASCYKSMMAKCTLSTKWVRNALWRHSLYCGIVCRSLDERLNLGIGSAAFTAGLLHDVGRLLLSTLEPGTYESVDQLDFCERKSDPRSAEQAAWDTDHCILGGWFLSQNGLPNDIVAAAALHHDGPGDTPYASVVALTRLGDDITNYFQSRDSVEGYIGAEAPELARLCVHYGSDFEANFLACVGDVMQQSLTEMVQIMAGETGGQ